MACFVTQVVYVFKKKKKNQKPHYYEENLSPVILDQCNVERISVVMRGRLDTGGSLSNDVFERCTSTGSGIFSLFGHDLNKLLGNRLFKSKLNKVYTWNLRHDVQCLTLLSTIWTEKVPLSYIPSIYKWYSFNIPSLELCIPVDCCKSVHCLQL